MVTGEQLRAFNAAGEARLQATRAKIREHQALTAEMFRSLHSVQAVSIVKDCAWDDYSLTLADCATHPAVSVQLAVVKAAPYRDQGEVSRVLYQGNFPYPEQLVRLRLCDSSVLEDFARFDLDLHDLAGVEFLMNHQNTPVRTKRWLRSILEQSAY